MELKIKSGFALLDVKQGRKKLAKIVEKNMVPVTIKGFINSRWSGDDGTSIEFEVLVNDVIIKKPLKK